MFERSYCPTRPTESVFVALFSEFLEIEFLEDGGDHKKVELDEIQPEIDEPQKEHVIQKDEGPSTHTLCRSSKTIRPPEHLSLIQERDLDVLLTEEIDPRTYREVMLDIDSEKWQEAMKSELDSIY